MNLKTPHGYGTRTGERLIYEKDFDLKYITGKKAMVSSDLAWAGAQPQTMPGKHELERGISGGYSLRLMRRSVRDKRICIAGPRVVVKQCHRGRGVFYCNDNEQSGRGSSLLDRETKAPTNQRKKYYDYGENPPQHF